MIPAAVLGGDLTRGEWESGKRSELSFWERWFATRGLDYPEDYLARQDPATPLEPAFARLVAQLPGRIRILDVGAGPLTKLGKRVPEREIEITAVDALAAEYDRVLARFGRIPLVRTRPCESERLTERLPGDAFDLVIAINTLDHSLDPLACIEQMLAVVRRGGLLAIRHATDEAVTGQYFGFHQWNFRREGEDMAVWRPGVHRRLRPLLAGRAELVELGAQPREAYAVFRKLPPDA